MGDKQRELDSIQRQYEAEAKQLSQLQERFSALEVEYNRIMDERRMDREQKQMAEEEMQSMIRAALLIQASWKSYKSRKVRTSSCCVCVYVSVSVCVSCVQAKYMVSITLAYSFVDLSSFWLCFSLSQPLDLSSATHRCR